MHTRRRPSRFQAFKRVTLCAFGVAALALMGFPLCTMVLSSLQMPGGGHFTLAHYRALAQDAVYQVALANSVTVALGSSLIAIPPALVCAYAISRVERPLVQRHMLSLLSFASNFAGLPLAFAMMLMLGSAGLMHTLLAHLGIDFAARFTLQTASGLMVPYVYLQLPLAVLLLYPVVLGVQRAWQEAAAMLGAYAPQFWLRIGLPVMLPSILSTFTILFANAMGAYATAIQIAPDTPLLALQISRLTMNGTPEGAAQGSALAIAMGLVLIVMMLINDWFSQIATGRGLRGQ